MEPNRAVRMRTFGVKALVPGLLVLVGVGFLVSSRWATPSRADGLAPGAPPPDGKYVNVNVEGREVPMIHVMKGGSVVLVDTDGKKPRTWEEQFKRKGDLPPGTFNIHKTNVSGAEDFANEPVDRVGIWVLDGNANIVAH
jgi:hypothetical protein